MNMVKSLDITKVTSRLVNGTYTALTQFSLKNAELLPLWVSATLPSLIVVVLKPKSSIFQVKFGVAMLGGDINLTCNIPVVVMTDAQRYLHPRVSSVLSKVGEFCLPGRFVFPPGSRGPVRDSSCLT